MGNGVGKVWLVGAGPGDAGLFTRKGYEVLQQAEVVVYDALVGDGVLALVPQAARKIDVGKRAANHTMRQEQISQVLLDEALGRKGPGYWCGGCLAASAWTAPCP